MYAQTQAFTQQTYHTGLDAQTVNGGFDRFHLSSEHNASPIRRLRPHDSLFGEGDQVGFLYEILEGVVCNYKLLPDGRRQVISFSYPGDLVGLGSSDTHAFGAEAVSPVQIRCISSATLRRTIERQPELGRTLLDATGRELARIRNQLLTLGRRSAIERIAAFLIDVGERSGKCIDDGQVVDLPMTRADIADFLGLTIETVSRNLTKLRTSGVIDLPQPTKVMVRDVGRLVDLAEGDGEEA